MGGDYSNCSMAISKYNLGDVLGKGEFGEVRRGINTHTNREVAIKTSHGKKGSASATALRHEGKIHAALHGVSGVPQLKECGWNSGRYFLVFPLLGKSWAQISGRAPSLSVRQTYAVGESVLRTLEKVHARGLIHRDVTPGNVMFGREKASVFLCDFGLACPYRNEQGHVSESPTRGLIGTPAFMSKWVRDGRRPSRRDDLEGLAFSIWSSLLNGKTPWVQEGLSTETLERMAAGMPALSAVLETIKYVRTLRYAEKPDYEHIAEMLRLGGTV